MKFGPGLLTIGDGLFGLGFSAQCHKDRRNPALSSSFVALT
jgi:hypothetical protein